MEDVDIKFAQQSIADTQVPSEMAGPKDCQFGASTEIPSFQPRQEAFKQGPTTRLLADHQLPVEDLEQNSGAYFSGYFGLRGTGLQQHSPFPIMAICARGEQALSQMYLQLLLKIALSESEFAFSFCFTQV